jgi:hypothetical protein
MSRPDSKEIKLGRCEFCEKPGVALVGRLKADPAARVCATCLGDERVGAEALPGGEVLACPCSFKVTIGDAVARTPLGADLRGLFREHGDACPRARRALSRRVSLWPRERNIP